MCIPYVTHGGKVHTFCQSSYTEVTHAVTKPAATQEHIQLGAAAVIGFVAALVFACLAVSLANVIMTPKPKARVPSRLAIKSNVWRR